MEGGKGCQAHKPQMFAPCHLPSTYPSGPVVGVGRKRAREGEEPMGRRAAWKAAAPARSPRCFPDLAPPRLARAVRQLAANAAWWGRRSHPGSDPAAGAPWEAGRAGIHDRLPESLSAQHWSCCGGGSDKQ